LPAKAAVLKANARADAAVIAIRVFLIDFSFSVLGFVYRVVLTSKFLTGGPGFSHT
jgi:hypothetical protein